MTPTEHPRSGPALLDRGPAYPVSLDDDERVHLMIPGIMQTLCNRNIFGTPQVVATFGPTDCDTCWRQARVRHLTVTLPQG
jgi:hypothetical protein